MSLQLQEAALERPFPHIHEIDYSLPWENLGIGYISERIADKAYLAAINVKNRVDKTTGNVGMLADAVWQEAYRGENRPRAIGSLAGVIAIQASGSLKVPSAILIPQVSVLALEKTGGSIPTALAASTASGFCGLITSRLWNGGVNNFPGAVNVAAATYPKIVGEVADTLPGLRTSDTEEIESETLVFDVSGQFSRLKSAIKSRFRRGVTSYTVGIMPYVVASGLEGQSKEDRNKLGRNLSFDGAAVVGAITLATSQAVIEIGEKNPQLAEDMLSGAGDMKFGYGIAGAIMLNEWIKNKRRNKKPAGTANI